MLNRDSLLWWIVIVGAAATYLGSMPEPWLWTWAQWMQTVAALTAVVAGKLATSPLPAGK